MSKVEEILNRINTHKGVKGILIINQDGNAIKTTMDQKETIEYATLISQFISKAKESVGKLWEGEEVTFLRLRSRQHEIMVAPDNNFSLIVLQNPGSDVEQIKSDQIRLLLFKA
eukprot:TRINITY_DN12347_c0_g1_i1.p1 TRINITY_DN12347_c0_g1~~TRINITY_DN12347_c0_g1_i1.p1  ORF type:complete len:114 (+),score=5.05 TRINITY_DN12347_c0_g1_i1:31-372(+)